MKNEEMTPRIRFKGFNDAWEQRKFLEIYKKVNEKNVEKDKNYKIISVANMYFKNEENRSSNEYMKTYNILKKGDISFEGNKSKNFSFGRFVENDIGDGIVSHVFEVFRPITNYDLHYWKYFINFEPIMKNVLRKSTTKSTMMTNLVSKDFLKQYINVPNLEEQNKIGKLLNEIDNAITFNEKKHKQLLLEKKLFIQKLFYTSWRFKGFDIPWKQRKLSEISKIIMGQSPDSKFYSDNQNNFVLVQGNADLKKGKVFPRVWTSVAKKTANNNEILITVRAPVGKLAITEDKVAIGRGVASIQGPKIIYYLLINLNYEKYWDKFVTGSTFESINSDILRNTQIKISLEKDENIKLIKLIENIDKLINSSDIKLAKLKQLKEYLMQNMFI